MLSDSSRESPGTEPCLSLAGRQAPGPWPQAPLAHIALPATACHYRFPGDLPAPLASLSLSLRTVLFVCSGGVGRSVTKEKSGASFNQIFSCVTNMAQLR